MQEFFRRSGPDWQINMICAWIVTHGNAVPCNCVSFTVPETAEVNIQLDSHVGGDIYRPMHPLMTFVAFHKLRN